MDIGADATEVRRLGTLRSYGLFGEPQDPEYDRVTQLGAEVFQVRICAVSIVGEDELWIKSCNCKDTRQLPRTLSFCHEAIFDPCPLIITDAADDPRFSASPLVMEYGVRFYAGVPLVAANGAVLGTFCILDNQPRESFSDRELSQLKHLAAIVVDLFERRLVYRGAEIMVPFAHVARQALVGTDANGRIKFWNRGAEKMLGYEAHEVEGELIDLIVPERFREEHRAVIARAVSNAPSSISGRTVEVIALRRDGSEFLAELSLNVWHGANGTGIGAQLRDVSEQRAREERLHHLANHDSLTGLLNRNSFRSRIEALLEDSDAATVMVLDLDGFKGVNDTLGHAAGDTLLQALALRLGGALGPQDMLARLGGDEFAILLANGHDLLTVPNLADTLLELVNQPFSIGGHQLHLSSSIGIALAPIHARNAEELVVRADLALFKAKSEGGRRYKLFDTGMENQLAATRAFQDELRFAIVQRQFELHFQPQISLSNGLVVGAEALLRWRHPTRGLLLPKAFLNVLETHPLAYDAGYWVLDEACRQLSEWRRAGLPVTRMGVNLFGAQLRSHTLVSEIEATLKRYGLGPKNLEIEITETIALHHGMQELQQIHDLHALGISVAFDDFGTGFASLSTLKDFPLSRLKVDRSFVQDLCTDQHSQAIVKGVITIGHSLGLDVIAEGIETAEQEALLRAWHCDAGQGYLYGRAVSADAFFAAHHTPAILESQPAAY